MLRNQNYNLANSHPFAMISLLCSLIAMLPLASAPAISAGKSSHSAALAGTASAAAQKATTSIIANQGLYDIDATNTDVKLILEALAQRSGADIVVSPEITGEVTAHLKQQSIESILDFLSTVHGFSWTKNGSAYLIASKEKLAKPSADKTAVEAPPEPELFIWKCRHTKGADLATVITKLYPDIKVAEGPGDSQPKLQDSTSNNTTTSNSQGNSSSSSTSTPDDGVTKLVIIGQPEQIAKVKGLLEKLDVRPMQVAIEVAITEISSSASKELGIDWTWSDVTLAERNNGGIGFGKFNKSDMSFNSVIKAMVSKDNAKLLAQPNIAVMDGAYAEILIGDRILFPKLTGYNQMGTPIYDKDEERVGIYLQLAVKITDQDDIIMTLYPQVSLVTKYLTTQAGSYPQISTREAKTTVSVRNGTTLAIGGLLQNNEIVDGSRIPLLGKLPIIGGLFRRSTTTKDHSELVIFLTPKIVKQD